MAGFAKFTLLPLLQLYVELRRTFVSFCFGFMEAAGQLEVSSNLDYVLIGRSGLNATGTCMVSSACVD